MKVIGMKRICMLLLVCLLLPEAALAVTEGVVESAPDVVIELPETGDVLFGMWEQGLEDIERAARKVLEERFNCPPDMLLFSVEVGDDMYVLNTNTGRWQDEGMRTYIYINFRFHREQMGGDMSAQVGFDFDTGKLGSCRLGRWYEGNEALELVHLELPSGKKSVDNQMRIELLDGYLKNALGLSGYEMTDYGQARFPDGSYISATIGSHTGSVIAVELSRFGEGDAVQ